MSFHVCTHLLRYLTVHMKAHALNIEVPLGSNFVHHIGKSLTRWWYVAKPHGYILWSHCSGSMFNLEHELQQKLLANSTLKACSAVRDCWGNHFDALFYTNTSKQFTRVLASRNRGNCRFIHKEGWPSHQWGAISGLVHSYCHLECHKKELEAKRI